MVRKERKPEIVDQIQDRVSRAQIVIAADYRGLTVAQISELRHRLRQHGIECHVVKNTLATFAAKAANKPNLTEFLKGPTALVFGYDDVVQPAKTLREYLQSTESGLSLKGGLLGDSKLLTSDDLTALAKLPPRDELVAKVVGMLQSPIVGLLNVLNGNLRGLAAVLQARAKQLEEGG